MINQSAEGSHTNRWPEGAIVYHIYPRSFFDTNGDGIGDLPGITAQLPYLKSLHVNAIWLSPFYPSPMADFGYDIADYCDVDPMFGTLDDFKALLAAAAKHDIKVIIDLVPNHTSDEHEWFKQSRTSRDNEYADWYIWRDAIINPDTYLPVPPNNWRDALTGESAWEWSKEREQFYLHSFDVKQPDLNWSNPEVRIAIQQTMRFWLDLGVDGFRVDAVYWMAKEPLLSDDGINSEYVEGEDLKYNAVTHNNSRGWPAVYAYLSELADVLEEPKYQDKLRFMITEAYPERHNPLAAYLTFYVAVNPRVAAPFNFEGVSLPWEAGLWRKFLKSFHVALQQFSDYCIPSYAFGNHDQPRMLDRLGSADAARAAAVMLLTLPGMAFIYYGEEIGMHNVHIPPEFVMDPAARGDPLHTIGRDPERTPMQWTADTHAGFSEADSTWLPLADDYTTNNVAVQSEQSGSFLSLYRQLGQLRAGSKALRYGAIHVHDVGDEDVLCFERSEGDEKLAIFINFGGDTITCNTKLRMQKIIVSSAGKVETALQTEDSVRLDPYEAVVAVLMVDN